MKKLLLFVFSLFISIEAVAKLPPYIDKNTFTSICKNVSCPKDFNSKYISTYFHKGFHKALALSTSKSGSRYSIDYFSWSWQYPSSIEAKSAALNNCKKSARNCEIFLVNNQYANEALYNKLNKSISSNSSSSIPSNAYKTSNAQGWKCNYSSYQNNGACLKLPANASASNGGGYYCNSGYRKSTAQNACVLKVNVPANAYASGSGWKCNSGFKQSGNSCIEIPDDTIYRAGSGTGFATTYDGHILTNHHVIDGCSQVTVHNKGKSYITTVITQDPKNDLAILISDYKPSKVYTLSTEVYLSDDIYAAGFPFGKRISSSIIVNRGIVSALMGPGDDISKFQIDADINSGNSGGPIVDKKGNAIGIAVSKLNREKALEELGSVPEGFNFAVNSMMAIGLFRSQGIDLPVKTDKELSVKDRNDLFNQGTFYLACGMTTAQYEKMAKTEKVMFTREVFFSDFQGN